MKILYSIFFILYLTSIEQMIAANCKFDSQSYYISATEDKSYKLESFESTDNQTMPFGLISEKDLNTSLTEHSSGFVKKKMVASNNVIYNITKKNYYQTQSFFISGKCTGSKKQFLKLNILLI